MRIASNKSALRSPWAVSGVIADGCADDSAGDRGGGVLGIVVWLLAQLGKVLIKVAEALAAAAVVMFTVWLLIKAVAWALRQVVIHWRTSLTLVGVLAWWQWRGWGLVGPPPRRGAPARFLWGGVGPGAPCAGGGGGG